MRRVGISVIAALLWAGCQDLERPSEGSRSTTDASEKAGAPGTPNCCDARAEAAAPDAGKNAIPGAKEASSLPASEPRSPTPELDAGELAAATESGAPALPGSGLPCGVAAILSKYCVTCHGAAPMSPMSLISHDDFAAPTPRDPAEKVHQRVKQRTHDPDRPMPPRSVPDRPSAEELAVLDAWLDSGAPRSSEDCTVVAPDAGVPDVPFDFDECEYQVDVHAWGGTGPDDPAPFQVPAGQDVYQCFTVEIPWDKPVHGIRFEPLIENPRVLHHLNLATVPKQVPAGSEPGRCLWEGQSSVTGWAPGGGVTVMPPDLGIGIADRTGATFQLEMHYSNVAGTEDVHDRSGVRVCATSKLRKNEAAEIALGSLCLGPLCSGLPPGKSEVTSTCLNLSTTGPAHVLWTYPHMHGLGRHMKTVITRADGTEEVLSDYDYDFNDQRGYPSGKLIHFGDVLTTTCTFENNTTRTVPYGETTNEEMCFNFLMVYPPDSITAIERFCGI